MSISHQESEQLEEQDSTQEVLPSFGATGNEDAFKDPFQD